MLKFSKNKFQKKVGKENEKTFEIFKKYYFLNGIFKIY
jgi:hypothetical protein